MKKINRLILLLIICTLILSLLPSCDFSNIFSDGKKSDKSDKDDDDEDDSFKFGKWSGKRFKNDWSGLKLTIPDEFEIYDRDEIADFVGVEGAIINGDKVTEKDFNKSDADIYDFVVSLPNKTSSIILGYRYLLDKSIDENAYFEALKKGLAENSINYIKHLEEKLNGEKYIAAYFIDETGLVYQKIFIRKKDNAIIYMTVTYTEENKHFIDGILKSMGNEGSKDEVEFKTVTPGSYSGNTFINKWAGIKFDLSEGFILLDDSTLKDLIGNNPSIIINDFKLKEEDLNRNAFTIYDAWVYFPDEVTNLSIGYEYSETLAFDADEYLEITKKNLVEDSGMDYRFDKRTEENIANEKYIVGYFTLESTIYQRIYVRQINEKSIMFMIATYMDDGESEMDSFLNSIVKA